MLRWAAALASRSAMVVPPCCLARAATAFISSTLLNRLAKDQTNMLSDVLALAFTISLNARTTSSRVDAGFGGGRRLPALDILWNLAKPDLLAGQLAIINRRMLRGGLIGRA